jgi:hypothetical protein
MDTRIHAAVNYPRKTVSGMVPEDILRQLEKAYLDGHEVSGLIMAKKGSNT